MKEEENREGPRSSSCGGGLAVDLPQATLEALDAWAKRSAVSRSQAARLLIEAALRRYEGYAAIDARE
jgi:hypothetical protein